MVMFRRLIVTDVAGRPVSPIFKRPSCPRRKPYIILGLPNLSEGWRSNL